MEKVANYKYRNKAEANTNKLQNQKRPQSASIPIRWSTLLNKMYEEAVENDQKLAIMPANGNNFQQLPIKDQQQQFRDGVMSLIGTLPSQNNLPEQNSTVFVTTSHSSSSTTTLTASGIKKTTSEVMSSRTVRVQNTNLGTMSASANSCNDLIKSLSSKNGPLSLNSAANTMPVSYSNFPDDSKGFPDDSKALCLRLPQNAIISNSPNEAKLSDLENRAIEEALSQTLVTFRGLLEKQREKFMEMFPQFVNERTKPKITIETVVRPDGSIVVIEKQESRHVLQMSHRTKIVNGVVKSSTTRAVMVYGGPEQGYELRLEDDDDDQNPDGGRKRGAKNDSDTDDDSRSLAADSMALSELTTDDDTCAIKAQKTPGSARKRALEKAWMAAQELVETERRYVSKLELLENIFRQRLLLLKDKTITSEKMTRLFSNLNSLLVFHSAHLLPQLENRLREWQQTQRISDVLCKLAPYLKLYSEYTSNYKKALKAFDELMSKNKRFSTLVAEIETLPECDNLLLKTHLICPVQRVTRYKLLLQEYLKNLPDEHQDQHDAELALEKVKVAADHANELMRKLDKYRDVIEIQEILGSQVQGLVTPSRELVKRGKLLKISGRTGDQQERTLFLFNDLLLLCNERSLPLSKYYKLKASLHIEGIQLLEGDDLELDYTFHIRSKDKRIQLQARNAQEKSTWMDTLWNCMQNHKMNRESFGKTDKSQSSRNGSRGDEAIMSQSLYSTASSDGTTSASSNRCSNCKSSLKFLNKETNCQKCNMQICKRCQKKVLAEQNNQDKPASEACKEKIMVCPHCAEEMSQTSISNPSSSALHGESKSATHSLKRKRYANSVKPGDDSVVKGTLTFKNAKSSQWLTRYFALHSDLVLYCFKDANDNELRSSMLLPGCVVDFLDSKQDSMVWASIRNISPSLIFKVTRNNTVYYFRGSEESNTVRWMAAMDLASQAEIPKKVFKGFNDDADA